MFAKRNKALERRRPPMGSPRLDRSQAISRLARSWKLWGAAFLLLAGSLTFLIALLGSGQADGPSSARVAGQQPYVARTREYWIQLENEEAWDTTPTSSIDRM